MDAEAGQSNIIWHEYGCDEHSQDFFSTEHGSENSNLNFFPPGNNFTSHNQNMFSAEYSFGHNYSDFFFTGYEMEMPPNFSCYFPNIPSLDNAMPSMENHQQVAVQATDTVATAAAGAAATASLDATPSENGSQSKSVEARIAELAIENNSLRQELHLAYEKIDRIDQDMKKNNLVFFGLNLSRQSASHHDESLLCIEAILHLCNHLLNLPITANDISSAYRMQYFKSQNKHPPIVVRFCRKLIRDEVYRQITIMLDTLNKSRPMDERIFIQEDLTWRNQQIKKAARQAIKDGKLADMWTESGYIIVKCNAGCIHLVEDAEELAIVISGKCK